MNHNANNQLNNPFVALRAGSSAHKLRIPDFYAAKPRLWFSQLEAQFRLANVTDDESKFYNIVASLQAEVASRIDFVIENPPPFNKYCTIKEALLNAFEKSPFELCAQALSMLPLGDRQPSQLMSDLVDLIPRHHKLVVCPFVVALFAEKLPADIRLGLNLDNVESYERLAAQADALMACRQKATVQNVNCEQNADEEDVIEISNVSKKFKKKNFGKNPKSVVNFNNSSNKNNLCWYHEKYADKATKCVKPCVYFSKN